MGSKPPWTARAVAQAMQTVAPPARYGRTFHRASHHSHIRMTKPTSAIGGVVHAAKAVEQPAAKMVQRPGSEAQMVIARTASAALSQRWEGIMIPWFAVSKISSRAAVQAA